MRSVALALMMLALRSAAAAAPAPIALGPITLTDVELMIVDAHGTRRTPVHLALTPGCAEGRRCYAGVAEDRDFSLVLQLGPGVRALPVSVEVKARDATSVRELDVRLVFGAHRLEVMGRDGKLVHAARASLGRLDPKWIAIDDAALLLDDDADAVRVAMSRSSSVTVDLALLSAQARPFGHLPRAGHHWRDIHGRVAVPDRWFHAGEVLTAHGELLLAAATPVARSPWPDGRAAAFVITDHADQTSAPTLHALLAGASDADLDHPTAGLLGHGVPITKALFQHGALPHDGARPQLEDPEVVALAERARAAGIEIVPHSATPVTDDRQTTDATLTWFGEHGARVWIDHQPQTNREGFNQAGWRAGTGIADLLTKHDFRDVWDLTEWQGTGLDERDPKHLEHLAPVIWPLGRLEPQGPVGLWMFRSTWAFIPSAHFFARYDVPALDTLEATRGIHIAHTYLETLHPRGTFFGRRNIMLRETATRVRLDPRFEALLADLHRRDQRGSMWIAPIGLVDERVRALREVQLRITEAGTLSVTRPQDLDGLTVELAAPMELAGDTLRGQRTDRQHTQAWLARCALTVEQSGAPPCTTELTLAGGSLWKSP